MSVAIPGAMLAQKLPLAKYLSATMFAWGLSTLLTVFVQSYHGLLAQRYVSPLYFSCIY